MVATSWYGQDVSQHIAHKTGYRIPEPFEQPCLFWYTPESEIIVVGMTKRL